MEDEIIVKMGDVADAAISGHHTRPYHERINALLDALHIISQERIEWANQQDCKEAVNG